MLLASVVVTLLLTLGLTRWFAPQLLGISSNLQLVKVQKEVPPFFDGVFQTEDSESKSFIISDPHINRALPLFPQDLDSSMGPNDLLGFRNRMVPNIADIITIGDSQTYGNNAVLEQNWPSQLASGLKGRTNGLYNMSVGGWGAAEYIEIFKKALHLKPSLVIVAYYTGNDPLDSFIRVYGDERYKSLRPDPTLKASDAPKVTFPPPVAEMWTRSFSDGTFSTFTPAYRHSSNRYDDPAIRAGYDIMARSAEEIAALAKGKDVRLIFTIIPTKEYVYAKRFFTEGIVPRDDYFALVRDEQKNIEYLSQRLNTAKGAIYADIVTPLQNAALTDSNLYPVDSNGHPAGEGYGVIANALKPYAEKYLAAKPCGPVIYTDSKGNTIQGIINNDELWIFASIELFEGNGWRTEKAIKIPSRYIENMPVAGVVRSIEPNKYGPNAKTFK